MMMQITFNYLKWGIAFPLHVTHKQNLQLLSGPWQTCPEYGVFGVYTVYGLCWFSWISQWDMLTYHAHGDVQKSPENQRKGRAAPGLCADGGLFFYSHPRPHNPVLISKHWVELYIELYFNGNNTHADDKCI